AAGAVEEPAQDLDLAGQETTGRTREPAGRSHDRGVGAVGGAEGVVDVEVAAVDQPVDEGRVVGLLPRVEAQALRQLDSGSELGQAPADRLHRVLRVGPALGPTQVAARGNRGPVLLAPLEGG